jgi:hypothetical protein
MAHPLHTYIHTYIHTYKTHLGPKTRFLLLSNRCWFVDVERLLCREDGSLVYSCSWSSSAQSFSGPSPLGLTNILYCLRFETPLTWRARSPYLHIPGAGWPSYTPRHWIPFSSPRTTRRSTVELFDPASTRSYGRLLERLSFYSLW